MNTINKLQSADKLFVSLSLVCLFLTTFPLAQGWIPIGDFIPRAIMLLFVAILWPKLLFQNDVFFLFLYFLIVYFAEPSQDLIQLVANLMEFVLPLVIAHFVMDNHNLRATKVFASFAIIITTVIMLMTIIANISYPNIVRQMVAFTAQGDEQNSILYRRMGVCSYSFALIAMCMAPVFLYLAREKGKKILFYTLFLLTIYFVFITGVTTCLIIVLYMATVAFLVRKHKNFTTLVPKFLVTAFLFIFFGTFIVEFAEPLLRDTTFESHFEGLFSYFGKGQASDNAYEFDERVDLYKYSLDTFFAHPLFGDAYGKIGGHNYFLDRFARNGIIGMIPFFALLYIRFKKAYYFIPISTKVTFTICIIGFFALGFLKNMSGIDYWTYMFVYVPCVLKYSEIRET